MTTTGLDHIGVAVPNLDAAAAEWEALGFTVQPLAPHLSDGMSGSICRMRSLTYLDVSFCERLSVHARIAMKQRKMGAPLFFLTP